MRCIKDDNSDVYNGKVHKTGNSIMVNSRFNKAQGIVTFEIEFRQKSKATLSIFNITGKKIKELSSGIYNPGIHQLTWDGISDNGNVVSNGTYYYQLTVGNRIITGQCMFLR